MTGRDLILYILSNNLENEPIFDDKGALVGFVTVDEAAVKMGVGAPTIYALIAQGKLDAIFIGSKYLVSANCELLDVERKE
jgi:excisionase family DNA binding protein